jgi:hypothetical protein
VCRTGPDPRIFRKSAHKGGKVVSQKHGPSFRSNKKERIPEFNGKNQVNVFNCGLVPSQITADTCGADKNNSRNLRMQPTTFRKTENMEIITEVILMYHRLRSIYKI